MTSTKNELISIVIPVYNGERDLEETLKSVFAQTYRNTELIVVDDGSTDGTLQILDRYAGQLRLIRQQNKGAAAARNLGVKEAKGSWIAFLDADDLWESSKLEQQMTACGSCAWSYTDFIFFGGVNDGQRDSVFTPKHQGWILEKIICGNFIGTSTVLVRRQALLDVGGFDESLRSIQDWDLWVRLSSKYESCYLGEPLVRYRVHAKSVSRGTRKTFPNHMKVIDKIFSKNGAGKDLIHLKPAAKSASSLICSQIAEEEGDYLFALECAANALKHQPKKQTYWVRFAKSFVKYVFFVLHVKGYAERKAR